MWAGPDITDMLTLNIVEGAGASFKDPSTRPSFTTFG